MTDEPQVRLPDPTQRPSASVLAVPEGSVLVIRGVDFGADLSAAMAQALLDAIGHSRFVVLHLPHDGSAEVWGPDTDLGAKVRELLGGQS